MTCKVHSRVSISSPGHMRSISLGPQVLLSSGDSRKTETLVSTHHILYPLIHQWTLGLSPHLGYCK